MSYQESTSNTATSPAQPGIARDPKAISDRDDQRCGESSNPMGGDASFQAKVICTCCSEHNMIIHASTHICTCIYTHASASVMILVHVPCVVCGCTRTHAGRAV